MFADDASLFTTMYNCNKEKNDLNNGPTEVTKWVFQWKMSFNLDISEQAHEIVFPAKCL